MRYRRTAGILHPFACIRKLFFSVRVWEVSYTKGPCLEMLVRPQTLELRNFDNAKSNVCIGRFRNRTPGRINKTKAEMLPWFFLPRPVNMFGTVYRHRGQGTPFKLGAELPPGFVVKLGNTFGVVYWMRGGAPNKLKCHWFLYIVMGSPLVIAFSFVMGNLL